MRAERKFGLTVGAVLAGLGGVLLLRHRVVQSVVLLGAGAILLLLGAAAPTLLARPRQGWMAFGRALGRVNSTVFLFLTFYLVLTPLGAVMRLCGRDELVRRRRVPGSMWSPYPERHRDVKHFEKMF